MMFLLASWGSRGEVEPCAAVGRELLRRGHEVRMAVPPDLVGFVESAGLAAVGYGPNLQAFLDPYREYWTCFFRNPWKIQTLVRLGLEVGKPFIESWAEMSATLTSLANDADLLLTTPGFEDAAANTAEHYDIPLATLHWYPLRANGQRMPFLPAPMGRSAVTVREWLHWRGTKNREDAQRRELGLPEATSPAPRRIAERGSLELQAYDEVCFPGLAAEWAKWDGQRPFVGALTLELPTEADEEVASWIAAGKPPIFFGFGSIPIESAGAIFAMIGAACAEIGERALICAAGSDTTRAPLSEHIKVVGMMNYAAAFPACRAVVHHGGAGTTAAGLRAGVPTLILSTDLDQTLRGVQLKRLKVGIAQRLSTTTQHSLVAGLRTILSPPYVARARAFAARMSKPAESVAAAADQLENFARLRCLG
jgi:UDP:flavonoid glycosyltransferase YjiC (YdhE family)